MGTKNNPKNRAKNVEKVIYEEKEIEPVFYHGKHAGHGNFMAARFVGSTSLVQDQTGTPLPWKKVIELIKK